jgi:hypothetical protein
MLPLAALVACAGAAPRERTVLAGNVARNVLILPLNVTAVMPAEIEAASPVVWEELEIYLRGQGKELKTVAFPVARQLWLSFIREARAANPRAGYYDAARLLVEELARHADFDAVILPSLYLREAPIEGRSARWDDVERPLEIDAKERLPADLPLEGVAPAASLHVVVLDPQGSKLQEAIAGLDLLVSVRVRRKRAWSADPLSVRFVAREHPFAKREYVQEGIAKALADFLPPPPPVEDRGSSLPSSPRESAILSSP